MKYLLLASLLFLCGCGSNTKTEIKDNHLYLKDTFGSYVVREMEYDGCQYIVMGAGSQLTVTHKGNCKYCLERNKGKQ